jgi:hypothetical protein
MKWIEVYLDPDSSGEAVFATTVSFVGEAQSTMGRDTVSRKT